MSNKKKLLKVAITVVALVVPFGLVSVGGYYAYKKYKEKKTDKSKDDSELINNKKDDTKLEK